MTDSEVTTTPVSNENPSEGTNESSNSGANVETTPAGFTKSFQGFLDDALHNLEVRFGKYSNDGEFLANFKVFTPKKWGRVKDIFGYGAKELNILLRTSEEAGEDGIGDFFTSEERDKIKLDWTTFKLEQFNSEECYTLRPAHYYARFMTDPAYHNQFVELKKFFKFIVGISISNTPVERNIAIMNVIKTERRATLSQTMLNQIMRIKVNTPSAGFLDSEMSKKVAVDFLYGDK